MKVAILGGTGFIAGRLTELLLECGAHSIVSAVRDPSKVKPHPRVEVRLLDAADEASVAAATHGTNGVVNCVMGSAEAMVASTKNTLAAAGRELRSVHLSSIAVYGDQSGLVTEESPLNATDTYGQAKVEGERLIGEASANGANTVVLRPALVYGPRSVQWTTRIARLLHRRRLGDLGESGDGWCDLIHVDEVCHAIVAALHRPGVNGEAYNLANPSPPTWNDYLMTFARELGYTPVRRIPGWQLKLERKVFAPALKVGEILAGKLGAAAAVPPPITPSFANLFDRRARYDSKKADVLLAQHRIDWRAAIADIAVGLR